MESTCRRWYLHLGCLLMMNLVYGNPEYLNVPASLGEIDNQCWETASLRLVDMKKLKVARTVMALWEFMMLLKESSKPKHNDIFNNLAQNFWDMYIDCVLSKSHGLGRRQLLSPESALMYLQKTTKGFNSRANPQKYRRYLGKRTSN